MSYCTKCGVHNQDSALFCNNCGAKIEKAFFDDRYNQAEEGLDSSRFNEGDTIECPKEKYNSDCYSDVEDLYKNRICSSSEAQEVRKGSKNIAGVMSIICAVLAVVMFALAFIFVKGEMTLPGLMLYGIELVLLIISFIRKESKEIHIIGLCVFIGMFFVIGLYGSQVLPYIAHHMMSGETTGNVKFQTTVERNDVIEEDLFESYLNMGKDMIGQKVRIVALELHPNSSFGYNVWAGEHLNFVSDNDPGIDVGESVVVRVNSVEKHNVSWIIEYTLDDESETETANLEKTTEDKNGTEFTFVGLTFTIPAIYEKKSDNLFETSDRNAGVNFTSTDTEASASDFRSKSEQLDELIIEEVISKFDYDDMSIPDAYGIDVAGFSAREYRITAKYKNKDAIIFVTLINNDKEKKFVFVYGAGVANSSFENDYKKIIESAVYKEKDKTEKNESSDSEIADSKTDDTKTSGGVDPKLKAFLDEYESFVDKYVSFMKKYYANPTDLSLLSEYYDIMVEYEDFAEKIDQYDSDEMSLEDAEYYLEVTTRCTQKMLDFLDDM